MVFVEIKDKARLIHLILTGLSEWVRTDGGGRTEEELHFLSCVSAYGWTQLKIVMVYPNFLGEYDSKE